MFTNIFIVWLNIWHLDSPTCSCIETKFTSFVISGELYSIPIKE